MQKRELHNEIPSQSLATCYDPLADVACDMSAQRVTYDMELSDVEDASAECFRKNRSQQFAQLHGIDTI